MEIIRYRTAADAEPRAGIREGAELFAIPGISSLAALWSLPMADLRVRVADRTPLPDPGLMLLPPVDGRTEVWAAGVTYESSRLARVEESEQSADVYEQVYDAERPELFFKSAAWRVVGDGQTAGVRDDSAINVPEPELALVINRFGEVAGYTVCNDMSSRSIEGANPLYLPQAKCYLGACALGPAIRPAWEVTDPYDLAITLTIFRDGVTAWHGEASTAALRRRFPELISYLLHADVYPDGVVLSTGTCLVPPAPFSVGNGDVVRISIAGIGVLTTGVAAGLPSLLAATGLG